MQVDLLALDKVHAQVYQALTVTASSNPQVRHYNKTIAMQVLHARNPGPGMDFWTLLTQAASSQLLPPMTHPQLTPFQRVITVALAQRLSF